MTFKLSARSIGRIEGVHPDLIRVVERAIRYSPYDFAVVEGLRTLARQRVLVAKGFSKTLHSKHLVQPDGYGHAVDIVAVGDLDRDGDIDAQDRVRTWDRTIYTDISHAVLGAAVELGVRVRWGGSFKTRDGRPWFDGPHFEVVGQY